jgi:hypothetical protein
MPERTRPPRIVLILGFAAIAAGLLVAVGLRTVSRNDQQARDEPEAIPAGLLGPLEETIDDRGAVYYADPRGGDGFWLTAEDGELVALVLDVEDRGCRLEFDPPTRAFTCDGGSIDIATVARHPVLVDDEDRVRVDVRTTEPAPVSAPSAS